MPAAPQILAVMCDQCGIGMVKVNFWRGTIITNKHQPFRNLI
jgi:hypothetical protein